MNILVIGGAGYIGSHVTKELIKNNYKTFIYDNLSSGLRENLFEESTFIHGDILDYVHLERVMKENNIEGVVHLAAFKAAGESMLKPEKYSVNNITGSLNILNACTEAGVKYLVFSSSAAVYGAPEYLPIDEKHNTNPENYYGYTKLAIENYMEWYDKLKGLKFASLRYFNAAGYDTEGKITGLEQAPANLVPVVMEVASGMRDSMSVFGDDYKTIDGTGVRDYIHVDDLAIAHVMSLKQISESQNSLKVNLGTGKGTSVLEIIKQTEEVTGKKVNHKIVERRPGDPAELYASCEEAKNILGWEAKYSDIQTILETTWKAYQANH